MRFVCSVVMMTFCGGAMMAAQAPPAPVTRVVAPAATVATSVSALLKPGLDSVQQAADGVRLDKWKASSSVRDEVDANLGSIRRDLETTLPPLVTAADGGPDSVGRLLPVFRNIGALYDVLLRVDAVGRLVAPGQQSAGLDQALAALDDTKRSLGDRLQVAALAQEKKVTDLQAALKAVPVAAPAPAVVVRSTPPVIEKKRAVHPKVVKKAAPATPAAASSTAAAAPATTTTSAPTKK